MSTGSPPLPTLGIGWLPPSLSPQLEAWVAAGRTGWVLPLPLGGEVGTWRAPPVADATAAHTWSLCRLLPRVLPSLPSPACHGRARRAPDPGPVGHAGKHLGTQVRQGPGQQPVGSPPPPARRRWPGGEPWASALGAPSLPLPETRQDSAGSSLLEVGGDRAVLSYLLGFLRCPGPRWGLSFSVCQRHLPDTALGESGNLAHSNCSETTALRPVVHFSSWTPQRTFRWGCFPSWGLGMWPLLCSGEDGRARVGRGGEAAGSPSQRLCPRGLQGQDGLWTQQPS